MEHVFDTVVKEFKELVAFQLSGKADKMTPVDQATLRAKIGKVVDGAATMVVGWHPRGMSGFSMQHTALSMSHARKDMLDRLSNEGIKYSQHVQDGRITVQLTDTESGVCIYRGVTNEFPDTELRKLVNQTCMELVSMH